MKYTISVTEHEEYEGDNKQKFQRDRPVFSQVCAEIDIAAVIAVVNKLEKKSDPLPPKP